VGVEDTGRRDAGFKLLGTPLEDLEGFIVLQQCGCGENREW
jgi:hypothetical protein